WVAGYRNRVAEEFALRLQQETGCVLADVNRCRVVEPEEIQGLNRQAGAGAREPAANRPGQRVGAAEAEGADSRQGWAVARRPRLALRRPAEAQPVEVDVRVGLREVEVAGDAAVVQGQGDLDQPGDAGGGLQVAEVRLHGADEAGLAVRPAGGQDPSQGPGLDG